MTAADSVAHPGAVELVASGDELLDRAMPTLVLVVVAQQIGGLRG